MHIRSLYTYMQNSAKQIKSSTLGRPSIFTCIHTYMESHAYAYISSTGEFGHTTLLIIIEGQFEVFQRFPSSKLVLKTFKSYFMALDYYMNGSTNVCSLILAHIHYTRMYMYIYTHMCTTDELGHAACVQNRGRSAHHEL